MAYNVFGNPITDTTLKGMPEYDNAEEISRVDRARVALNQKNGARKDAIALEHVEKLKASWGNGVSTLCLIYNATGDTVTYVTDHDWHGHIGPAPYPVIIQNGQWGGYLHVKTAGTPTGSSAAVVYRGKNDVGKECDWMVSWSNSWYRSVWNNTVYTEIREANHYDNHVSWDYISDLLYKSRLNDTDEMEGCFSTVSTGSDTSPIFEGILMLSKARTP